MNKKTSEISYLAIIPARGGSKRLPNKNILPLNGKPLISYSIKAALSSKYIDKVIVSSDSKKILKVEANGYVPVIRNLPAGAVLPDTILLEPLESEENVKIEQTEEGVTITSSQVEVEIPNVKKNRRALRAFAQVSSVEVGYINPGRNPENMPGDFKGYFNGSVILN